MKKIVLPRSVFHQSLMLFCVAALGIAVFPACHFCRDKKWWVPPTPAKATSPSQATTAIVNFFSFSDPVSSMRWEVSHQLEPAEKAYARASADPQQAVDAYYEALVWSWAFICRYREFSPLDSELDRAWDIYHSSLAGLITSGQKTGRLNLQRGLLVRNPKGMEWIPIQFNEFSWPPNSFNELIPVGCYHDKNLLHQYRSCGLGVPLVAVQKNNPQTVALSRYFFQQTPFAATGVLFPNLEPWIKVSATSQQDHSHAPGLILYDPLKVTSVQDGNTSYHLAADVTAPLGFLGQQGDWHPVKEYARPETDPNLAGLRMFEPYQPGKIPILFVHGLFSDPQTYFEMANRIRSCPELKARYQIWVFRYPTGGNFFLSAAKLRQQIAALVAECGTQGGEAELRQMVIVGHSLGGLVAKLQVSDSSTILWQGVARVPLNQIVASPEERHRLQREFFFNPSPYIKTAIFIATPNEGSPWAKRPVGKVASKMVEYSPEQSLQHEQLIQKNPGIFLPVMQKRIPTSVDLMNPDNELLHAIERLPLAPWVQTYAIAGTGGSALSRMGPSDGVVPLQSATNPPSCKTFYVDAVHTDILRDTRTIDIVTEILRTRNVHHP